MIDSFCCINRGANHASSSSSSSFFFFFSTPDHLLPFSPSLFQKKRRHHHSRPKPKPKPPTGGAVNRPVAYLPPHKLSLTPEERAAPPLTPVQRGREEVAALCSVLPEGSADKTECEEALVYYERMAGGDGEACSLAAEAAASGAAPTTTTTSTSPWTSSASSRFADPSCADERERFESFVRELLYAGSVTAFVKALGRRKREEERRREKEEGSSSSSSSPPSTSSPPSSSSPSPAEIDAETERRRRGLVALFRRYDRDGNGRLDAAEFREAAAAAGDPLTGSEVAKIFTALDIHGAGVSLDDFLAAVEVIKRDEEKKKVFSFREISLSFFFAHPFSLSFSNQIKKKLPLSHTHRPRTL